MATDKRRHSSRVVDGLTNAPARAMLRAVGFTDEDFTKPQVGIASTWSMVTPCNMHIDELARDAAAKGADEAGGKAIVFNTITVSDGISMGTDGMSYSLVSREVIADSIETVVGAKASTASSRSAAATRTCRAARWRWRGSNRPACSSTAARSSPGTRAARHHLGVRSRRQHAAANRSTDAQLQRGRSNRDSRPRLVRRHVHREHDGLGDRSAGLSLPNSSAQEAVSENKTPRFVNARRRGR